MYGVKILDTSVDVRKEDLLMTIICEKYVSLIYGFISHKIAVTDCIM